MATKRDLVAVGGSAGAVDALIHVVAKLPADFAAAIVVALHVGDRSQLPRILGRAGRLPVEEAATGTRLATGRIYVAPANQHLLVDDGAIQLSRGPKENGFRPAIDPLFRSVAESKGTRAIGVLLSGALDDGVEGLRAIKERGGITVAQDPREALVESMPLHAIRTVGVHHVAAVSELPALLRKLVGEESAEGPSAGGQVAPKPADLPVAPSCPACGGALQELHQDPLRYGCHVGHQYSGESLAAAQGEDLERALWTAVRVLGDHAALQSRMANGSRNKNLSGLAGAYELRAANAKRRAEEILTAIDEMTKTSDR